MDNIGAKNEHNLNKFKSLHHQSLHKSQLKLMNNISHIRQ